MNLPTPGSMITLYPALSPAPYTSWRIITRPTQVLLLGIFDTQNTYYQSNSLGTNKRLLIRLDDALTSRWYLPVSMLFPVDPLQARLAHKARTQELIL